MTTTQSVGTPVSARVWSPQQFSVFEAVADASPDAPHLVVEALAGTGKTTTIVEALCRLIAANPGRRVVLVAFNKIIAKELERAITKRLGGIPAGVEVRTLHSYGLRAITKAQGRRALDASAARARIVALGSAWERWEAQEARMACAKLISSAKGSLCVPDLDALDDAIDTASIELPADEAEWPRERIVTAAARVLQQTASDSRGPIDFDDMIWLPIVQELPVATFASVFVDETQDLNPAQLELVLRAAGKRGRITAIGDRNQAIYGFRGADRSAIPRMIDRLAAEVLPLSITYRCPKAVVREAQRYVPHFVAAESAPEGIVRHTDLDALRAGAAPGDFVISRLNAPLVSLAFHWLAAGRRCEIRGRDIGAGLAALVKKLAKGREELGIAGLRDALSAWEGNEIRRLAAKDLDTTNVSDKAACIRALAEGAAGIEDLQGRIARLFSDEADGSAGKRGGIVLTSAHRSKGLEADRVWMLRDTFRPEKGTEERNLCYVAITRAKRELVFVRGEASE